MKWLILNFKFQTLFDAVFYIIRKKYIYSNLIIYEK